MAGNVAIADLISALQQVDRGGMSRIGGGRRDAPAFTPTTSMFYGLGLFSPCGDMDIISLLIRDEAFSGWLRWAPSQEVNRVVKMITWIGPDGSSWDVQVPTVGYMSDKCAPPHSVEWGKCEIVLNKGLLGRCGQPIAAIDIGRKYCETEPIYRVNGSVIGNDAEWQASIAGMVLKDDISQLLVAGSAVTAGQFNGLENIVVEGYTDYRTGTPCTQVDSIVIDWNNQTVANLPATIAEIITRILYRARGLGGIRPEDIVISLPAFMRDCLAAEYACGDIPCTDESAALPVVRDAVGVRELRNRYMTGGAYGDGFVPVNGRPISFLVNDWIPFQSCPGGGANSFVTDIYILVRRVGPIEVLRGEYQDLRPSAAELARRFGAGSFQITDGGKFLVYSRLDETCFQTCLLVVPGLYCSAPWAQARISNVCCTVNQLAPLSPDVTTDYFLNVGDLYEAVAPNALVI